jgi:hypothetical protein
LAINFRTVEFAHCSLALTCLTESCLGIPISRLSKTILQVRRTVKGLTVGDGIDHAGNGVIDGNSGPSPSDRLTGSKELKTLAKTQPI